MERMINAFSINIVNMETFHKRGEWPRWRVEERHLVFVGRMSIEINQWGMLYAPVNLWTKKKVIH